VVTGSGKTSALVWIVYSLGILGGLLLVGSAIVSAILALASDATVGISFRGLVVCVVLVGAAVALKVWRSTRGRS
jgi:hypothetical protein